jgi:hypothetical protein
MQRLEIVTSFLCLVIATSAISSYAYARNYFSFLLYEQKTRLWDIDLGTTYLQEPRTIKITAESNVKRNERVVYNIEICGPKGFSNKDIVLSWQDSDGHSYSIGAGGRQSFKGATTLRWQSAVVVFKANHKNSIALTLTFLMTAHLGRYDAKIWMENR